jgi:hypothetical protein
MAESDCCVVHRRPALDEVGEERLVRTIVETAREDWRAAAWLLERRYPERFGRPGRRAAEPAAFEGPDGLDELSGRRNARRAGR